MCSEDLGLSVDILAPGNRNMNHRLWILWHILERNLLLVCHFRLRSFLPLVDRSQKFDLTWRAASVSWLSCATSSSQSLSKILRPSAMWSSWAPSSELLCGLACRRWWCTSTSAARMKICMPLRSSIRSPALLSPRPSGMLLAWGDLATGASCRTWRRSAQRPILSEWDAVGQWAHWFAVIIAWTFEGALSSSVQINIIFKSVWRSTGVIKPLAAAWWQRDDKTVRPDTKRTSEFLV